MWIAGAVAFVALLGMIAIVMHARDSDNSKDAAHATGPFTLGRLQPAAAPFAKFSEARVAVDDRCLRVLVATTSAQRIAGLRDVRDLGPYDGMLFVFSSDSFVRFTMADTPMPLDIVWYAANGAPIDHTSMQPCPQGTDENCPSYGPRAKFRYALETAAGGAASGSLGACAA